MSRPASETHLALLQAAHSIRRERIASGQGATLLELVERSKICYRIARALVPKLKRRGQLQVVGQRRVSYRNRPVSEYAPASDLSLEDVPGMTGGIVLSNCMQSWTR